MPVKWLENRLPDGTVLSMMALHDTTLVTIIRINGDYDLFVNGFAVAQGIDLEHAKATAETYLD
jgi:hypothetical protein